MSEARPGIGGGSMGTELVELKPGRLLADGRYETLFAHHATEQEAYAVSHCTHVAKDVKHSRCVTVRILGKAASKEQSVEVPAHIQKILEGAHRANDFVVLPLDSFWLDNEDEFFCIVNELYGHNLSTILDQGLNGPESARWTRKLFQETLMALSLLHSCDISHGDVMEWSILLTYPVLKFANFEGVQKSYQSQDLGTSETEGPDTSDTEEPSVNFDFRVKLQNLRKAFHTSDRPKDVSRFMLLTCPPPELLLENVIGPATDIWNLGIMMANVISSTPDFVTMIGGRRTQDKPKQLRETQRFLGPLPSSITELLPSTSSEEDVEVGSDGSLLDEIISSRSTYLETEAAASLQEEEQRDRFSKQSLVSAADLLKKMLAYDVKNRYTAQQALGHEFFHMH